MRKHKLNLIGIISGLILIYSLGCSNNRTQSDKTEESKALPKISKIEFDTLKDWDLGWRLLEPIEKNISQKDELQFLNHLSDGQRALYVFWDLNSEVTNGGFIQYYWNDYGKFVPELEKGLKLVGDTIILGLVIKSKIEYQKNKSFFDLQRAKDDWVPIYDKLKSFDSLDSLYYKHQHAAMLLFEKYIRQNPEEFAKVTD